MAWFRVDDSFHSHPKVLAIPKRDRDAALGLWVLLGSWCAQHLTDGFVAREVYRNCLRDASGRPPRGQHVASVLTACGLWDACEGGWLYHDWADYNPTRESVRRERELGADRQKRWREAGNQARRQAAGQTGGGRGRNALLTTDGDDTPTRPDPTHVTPTALHTPAASPPTPGGDLDTASGGGDFEEFWAAYPRKVGKAQARRNWVKATQEADPTVIIAGAHRVAADPNLPSGHDRRFVPHPGTWLTRAGWEDEAYPNRWHSTTDDRVAQAQALLPWAEEQDRRAAGIAREIEAGRLFVLGDEAG